MPFPRDRTTLGGWSQGAATALALGLAAETPAPAAIVALGGRLLPQARPRAVRVFISHGTRDESIPVAAARDALIAAGADVSYVETDVGHEIGPYVIPDLQKFIAQLP